MDILHIGPDRSFTAFLVGLFEQVAPGENRMLLQTNINKVDATYDFGGVPLLTTDATVPDEAQVADAASADVLVVHGMSRLPSEIIDRLSPDARPLIIWSGWGFDYYREPWHTDDYFGPRTTAYASRIHDWMRDDPDLAARMQREDDLRAAAARRTDFFSAPVPTDLAVLQREYAGFAGEYRQLNYGDLDALVPNPGIATGTNILVGNSATPANNHAEVFAQLAKSKLGDRDVIVPLSYGDERYARFVIGSGEKLLGERFKPVRDFMPLPEFSELLRSCSVAVFNHRRQQALGNIVSLLAQGTHLYMDDVNPMKPWLESVGFEIGSTADLRGRLPRKPRSEAEIAQIRRLLDQQWSTKVVTQNVKRLVRELRTRTEPSLFRRLVRRR